MKIKERIDEQAALIENFISFFSILSESTKQDGVRHSYHSNINHPVFKGIFPNTTTAKITQNEIQDAIDLFNGRPFSWWVTNRQIESSKTQILSRHHFKLGPHYSGMIYHLEDFEDNMNLHLPAGYTLETIHSPNELTDWVKPIQESFGFTDEVANDYKTVFQRKFEQINCQHYAIRHKNHCIGTGSIFIEGPVCGFYNLSVSAPYRHQQMAANMHQHRLRVAKDLGCQYVILQASEMAYHLGKRFGFKEITKFIPYIWGE